MKDFKQVTEEEAKQFLFGYPKSKLVWNVHTVCEPLMGSYNDFRLGIWPESMVAKVHMDGDRENWKWFIVQGD